MDTFFIIFLVLLVDSLGAVFTTWFGGRWYTKHFRIVSRYFPPAKGWALYYLLLTVFIGCILYNVGLTPWS